MHAQRNRADIASRQGMLAPPKYYYNLCNVKIIYHVTWKCVSRAFCSFQIRPGFGTRALYPLSLR